MHLLDFLFPPRCVGCNKLGSYICKTCFSTIRFLDHQVCPVCVKSAIDGATHPRCRSPYGLDGMYAPVRYNGVIRNAVRFVKYRYVSDIIDTLVTLLMQQYPSFMPSFDALVPVPLHPKRRSQRGFNQSLLLAARLGERVETPVVDGILKRVRYTAPQFGLKREDRKRNMLGAFSYEESSDAIEGKSIGLVDDVATTMATLCECAKVLKRRGASTVWGIVVAHG